VIFVNLTNKSIRLRADDADALKNAGVLTLYIYNIYIYTVYICCAFVGLDNKLTRWTVHTPK
jgi:hypothetical protein